jgi:CTP:molybdopterin cytidylyltransferase MocA
MTVGVVLAAGAGTRIGSPKALLEAQDREPFVTRACRVLAEAGADEIIVVTSTALASTVRAIIGGRTRIVINEQPELGQLSSMRCAIVSLSNVPDALIVLPVDVPLVSVGTIRQLLARWRETRAPVVRPVAGARHGHPVIFDRAIVPDLLAANGPDGAKPIVRAHTSPAGEVEVEDEGAFLDIDSPEDYRKAFNRLPRAVALR